MTRVSSSPPEIWVDVCMSSKKAITDAIKRFEEILEEVRRQIEAGDSRAIESLFVEARQLRETWIKPISDEQQRAMSNE
jgi:prephenate dehydrogenase